MLAARRSGTVAALTAALSASALTAAAFAGPARDHLSGETTGEHTLEGGDPSRGFAFLRVGPGEPYAVRDELARPEPGRDERRRSLVYLAQLSDFQISDEESPSRVEFLDRDPSGFATSAWRPQEALVALQVEYTIRQVNRLLDSPVPQGDGRRARMLNAVVTGDQADNQQLNETGWVLRLLEGGLVEPGSGTQDLNDPLCPRDGSLVRDFEDPRRYTGVQDYGDYLLGDPIFYDPSDVRGIYAERSWPSYPGLMDRAQEPFPARGLAVPSYVAFGNHDALAQGNAAAIAPFERVGTGCVKPLAPIGDRNHPLDTVEDPSALLARAIAEPDKFMLVPRDAQRRYVDKLEYKRIFTTPRQDDAHGFAFVDEDELRASDGAASYYSFEPAPGIRYIVLDTVSEAGVVGESSNGNIDDPQFRWLEAELAAAQRRDELILVFAHHALGSLSSDLPDEVAPPCVADGGVNPGCDHDPRTSSPIHGGGDLEALLHRFPNAIALIAGHSHENRVRPVQREGGGGFWEIKSPAVVDWPTQHRLIEVMDNRDGTLSIFGTMVDHDGPATAPGGRDASQLSLDELVALGRTLAYNDPQVGPGPGTGSEGAAQRGVGPQGLPTDRNVELLIGDPRAAAAGAAPGRERRRERRREAAERKRSEAREPGDAAARATASARAEEGRLPFTGQDARSLAVLGGLLLTAGGLARRRSRRIP